MLLLGLIGFGLVYVSTAKYGVGITSVSCDYVAAARSLADGGGLFLHDGTPYLDFPPLLPMLLGLFDLVGIDPLDAIRFLNALSFGLLIWLTGVWLLRRVALRPFVVLGAAAVLCSVQVLGAAIFAWPEAIFSLIVVLFLLELEKLLDAGGRASLVRAVLLAAVACSLRYIGVTLVATAVVCIFLGQKAGRRDKVRNALVFLLISLAPLALWFIRNYAVSGTVAGERGPSPYPFVDNLVGALSIVGGWFFSLRVGKAPRVVLLGILVVVLGAAFVAQRRTIARPTSTTGIRPFMPAIVFVLVYTGTMVILASTIALDRMNSRFLVPIYAPLLWVVVAGVENLRRVLGSRLPRVAVSTVLTLSFALWIAYWGRIETRWVAQYYRHGAGGLSTDEWRSSETVAYLKGAPIDGAIYSNEPWALYMLAGMSAHLSPRKHLFHSPASPTDDLDRFRDVVSESDVYLVWIDRLDRANLHTVEELRAVCRLEKLHQFSDGTIYAVNGREK